MDRNPTVYILCSENRRALYIGVTTNLVRRIEEHRRGLVEHTARYHIHQLVYFEPHDTASDAIARKSS
ncbi:GIY-YIG nuclease family protein [Reyranella sp.]|uniref:GIY-YIG nuclease family protein n=1 Tax=Reyranella sp. TaxID=1929291 RepID=UPI00342C2866